MNLFEGPFNYLALSNDRMIKVAAAETASANSFRRDGRKGDKKESEYHIVL